MDGAVSLFTLSCGDRSVRRTYVRLVQAALAWREGVDWPLTVPRGAHPAAGRLLRADDRKVKNLGGDDPCPERNFVISDAPNTLADELATF